ncbi:MAG TPA: DUF4279 domain-containing protein [Ktedonobacterales bacterium]|nr:DUF4279 domain-containing protein [Ktedonobacterales bacterium]
MSENRLSLRLVGELPPDQELTAMFGVHPTTSRRRGMPIGRTGRPTTEDVWSVELISRSEWTHSRPDVAAVDNALRQLQSMIPALSHLDRTRCRVQLYISSIREEEQGGFELPAEFVAVAGAAHMEVFVSILVDWPDDASELSRQA